MSKEFELMKEMVKIGNQHDQEKIVDFIVENIDNMGQGLFSVSINALELTKDNINKYKDKLKPFSQLEIESGLRDNFRKSYLIDLIEECLNG